MDEARLDALRARIRALADATGPTGWMDLPVPEAVAAGGLLRVPRGAFERWAVSRSGGDHLTLPWTPVSPPGLKLRGDDRYHSDWILGAGLPLDAMSRDGTYPHAEVLTDAAYAGMDAVARRLLDHDCPVLLPGPDVIGRAHHPEHPGDFPEADPDARPCVLVLRDAGPDYLELAVETLDRGGAVVVERGGQMAHLITVLREDGRGPIVRREGARRLLPHGGLVEVVPSIGRIRLRDDGRPSSGQGDPQAGPDDRAEAGAELAPGDRAAPVPGSHDDGPPERWPLRIVDEAELCLIEANERAAERRRRKAEEIDPGPYALQERKVLVTGNPDDPDRDRHPIETTSRMEPAFSAELRDARVHVNAHWSPDHPRARYLEIIVHDTSDGRPAGARGGRRKIYVAPPCDWGRAGIRGACDRALAEARAAWTLESAPETDPEPDDGSTGLAP